ncbi:hypothetical protein PIN31009_05580 [Pandoraea iniqua]|uniref:hypothetical protein n=1 Tax=Pandoraea iniqua TaxID=2508288 RepID=UPI001241306A|nr:hypothetical protein [Pandoraea iniqua]VVE59542.1 hypothetical protein PIN31009_05580 [Pandoraea iniqua]
MAKITQRPTVHVGAVFEFSEAEMRALDALTGYGVDAFLEVFYRQLGKTYMQPHEAGLRELFESVREQIPAILQRANEARKAFTANQAKGM